MKHEYKRPEIIIHKFETNDVIATSCTCPNDCLHVMSNVFGNEKVYFHNEEELEALFIQRWGNDAMKPWYYNYNVPKVYGECEEHGTIWEIDKIQRN